MIVAVPGGDAAAVVRAVTRGRIIGMASNQARALANEPGNVLTPREFASRVAASLLSAAGLPDLIADSPEDYEALALRIPDVLRDEGLFVFG